MKKKICMISVAAAGTLLAAGIHIHRETKRRQDKARAEGRHVPYGPYEACIKRPLDFILSAAALVVLSPVLLVTAVLVRAKLGSPVIFTQERPGKDGKIFRIHKFRTMTDERDEEGVLLSDEKRLGDFGRTLRSTSLDELPELFNIVKGEMSIVGPRPLLVRYLPFYYDSEKCRHDVRPGLTGLAQVSGRNNLKWDDRIRRDAEYVGKITFLGDCGIILKTVYKVLMKEDVAADTGAVETYLDVERQERRTGMEFHAMEACK